jgi:predicted O-linked N-acetylglucosamine transferase (SPINDLY family)
MINVAELFAQAKAAHQAGRLAQAEPLYRQVLQADPSQVAAWYLRGVACQSLGRLAEAQQCLREAVRRQPGHVEAWNHLGIVLAQTANADEAVSCFRQALTLRPSFLEAHRNLALTLDRQGRLDEAAQSYRALLRLRPDDADLLRVLASVLRRQGRFGEAETCYRAVLRTRPDDAGLHVDLGSVLEKQGKLDDAVRSCREALRLRPSFSQAHTCLGAALVKQGKLDEAEASYREAARLQPDAAEAHNNLGALLQRRERWSEAEASLRTALRLRPDFAEALSNLGSQVGKHGRYDEAESLCRRALALRPDSADARHNLAFALAQTGRQAEAIVVLREAVRLRPDFVEALFTLGILVGRAGQLDEGEALCREAVRLRPESGEAHTNLAYILTEQGRVAEAVSSCREALRLLPESTDACSSYLYALNYDPAISPETLLEEHRRCVAAWPAAEESRVESRESRASKESRVESEESRASEVTSPDSRLLTLASWLSTLDSSLSTLADRCLRVGYVSPDLRGHPVAFFLEPILAHHDRSRVEAICYAEVAAPDAFTARLKSLAHDWCSTCGMTDEQVAERVRADRIDILVDLAGHTARNRLGVFARRPAPVQATYLGYPCTTGLTTIDYLLTDAVVDPPGEPAWSTEEPFRLPGGFCCYAPMPDAPEVSPAPALRSGVVTFGSLHKLAKLTAPVLDLWADLLLALPTARLLLFRTNLQGRRRDEILAHFTQRGIAAERVELRHTLEGSHLRIYQNIDVLLDVFPWCGHTTACEALWMGVPVVTLLGDRHAGRMTASILSMVGLTGLIARTRAEYLAVASRLAGDVAELGRMRAGLRTRMRTSPLCDGPSWVRQLETAYQEMWQRRQARPPSGMA